MQGLALYIALIVGCVLVLPAPAAAKQRQFVIDPSRTSEAHLHGTHGYAVSLYASGSDVSLTVTGHRATVHYSVRGRVTKQLIKARFGRLGRVSLRFHPSQKPHRAHKFPDGCRGGEEMVEPGEFVGAIEFVGERRYTEVHTRHAEGKVTKTAKGVCRSQGGEGGRSHVGVLVLQAETEDGGASFTALRPKSNSDGPPDVALFFASKIELHRKLFIVRTIESRSDSSAFLSTMSHGKLAGATIEPPAPFSGSATYLKKPPTPSEGWTGDLTGEFPGVGKVSLTGSNFCAESMLLSECEGSSAAFVALG